jgi:hypothetical protein
MRLVSQLDCRSSETSSILVRGAKCRAAHGGQPVSKSGEQRSIRWLGATRGCAEAARLPCKQALPERYRASPPHCSRPTARITAWYAVRAGGLRSRLSPRMLGTFAPLRCDSRRELFARGGAPRPRRRKRSTRSRFRKRGVPERPRRKGERSRQEQLLRVRCSRPHAWLPTKRTRIVPERAHPAPEVLRQHATLPRWMTESDSRRAHRRRAALACGARCKRATDRLDSDARLQAPTDRRRGAF